ncbi:ankyrin repeat protein, putative [hydrothermal vent metagenome]|uniref:Ankyrin repeat protein, putative n=1 Tax=hydrothermal vent metagenome TaxID=652676 RepID=A0A1W1BT42_9ZZZZ
MKELAEAIENDSIVKVRALCKAGADLSAPIDAGLEYGLEDPDNMPVLFYAIRKYASIELIEVLLEYGCDIREIDEDGLSAIDIAIKFKREDVVKFCVEKKGMSVNETHRPSGITPIVLSACFNNPSMVELLISYGAELNSKDKNGMSAKDYAKKLGQKKMVAFLHERGAKHSRYPEENITSSATVVNSNPQGDMKNRKAPTEDMGFDSI